MAYDGATLDDVGYDEDEQKRKAAIPPPPPIMQQPLDLPQRGLDLTSAPLGRSLDEAPPITRAPQTTASATNELPPVTQRQDDEKESPRRGRFDLYPPVKLPAQPYEVNLPGDVTPGIGRARGELAGRPPDIAAAPIPEAPAITAPTEPRAPTPAANAYEALRAKGPAWQREGKGGKLLDILGMTTGVGRNIERASGLGSLGYQSRLGAARTAAQDERNREFEEARTDEQEARAENERAKANVPTKRQYENIQQVHADAVQDAIARGVDPGKDRKVLQVEDSIQRIQREPAQRPAFTNPFEAFTFGTPKQKQSAQDFLQFEKRMDRQNQKPTEAEFRYSLYLRDPETYKAMYGDKGEAATERARVANRAHATTMLKYFDKRRDEISKDYTLGDDEKKQKLAEIDELEKPFKDAATAGGKDADRVEVIHPNGQHGTIPRSQLGAAKRKGYKEAPRQ